MTLSVAFVGLGKMGSGMALRIHAAGFPLVVYNRSPGKAAAFTALGVTVATTAREAAANADVVVSSLMDDASVLGAAEGPDGIVAGMRPLAVHVGTTTISPGASDELARLHRAHASEYVAAPVLGRPDAAAAGRLITMLGGTEGAIERCRPVLAAYTSKQIVVGPSAGAAASLKLLANFVVVSTIELFGQAIVFGERRGLPTEAVTAVLDALAPGPITQVYSERIRERRFDDPGFEMKAGLKDVELMLAAAHDVHAALPYASLIREQMRIAIERGQSAEDWSGFTEVLRDA